MYSAGGRRDSVPKEYTTNLLQSLLDGSAYDTWTHHSRVEGLTESHRCCAGSRGNECLHETIEILFC